MSILTFITFLLIQALAESANQTQTCPDDGSLEELDLDFQEGSNWIVDKEEIFNDKLTVNWANFLPLDSVMTVKIFVEERPELHTENVKEIMKGQKTIKNPLRNCTTETIFLRLHVLCGGIKNIRQTIRPFQHFDPETQPRSTEEGSDRLVIDTLTGITKDGTNKEITKGIISCLLDIKIKDEQKTTLAHITNLTSKSVDFNTNCTKQTLVFTYRFIGIEKSKIVTSECSRNNSLIIGLTVCGIIIILNILAFYLIWRRRRLREEAIQMDEHLQGVDYYETEDRHESENHQEYEYYHTYATLAPSQ